MEGRVKKKSPAEMSDEEIRIAVEEFREEDREVVRVRYNRRQDYEDAEKRGTDTSKLPKLNSTLRKIDEVVTESRAYNEMFLVRAKFEEEKSRKEEEEELLLAILRGEIEL